MILLTSVDFICKSVHPEKHSSVHLLCTLVICKRQDADAEDFASVGSEHEQPKVDEADGRYDNQDEVEEADHLQHLREAGIAGMIRNVKALDADVSWAVISSSLFQTLISLRFLT